ELRDVVVNILAMALIVEADAHDVGLATGFADVLIEPVEVLLAGHSVMTVCAVGDELPAQEPELGVGIDLDAEIGVGADQGVAPPVTVAPIDLVLLPAQVVADGAKAVELSLRDVRHRFVAEEVHARAGGEWRRIVGREVASRPREVETLKTAWAPVAGNDDS